MNPPFHSQSFTATTFASAARTWPRLHPIHAAMRALGSGRPPDANSEVLCRRRDRELAFWAGLPGVEQLRQGIERRYAARIADAERQADREIRIAAVEAALDQAEATLARCAAMVAAG